MSFLSDLGSISGDGGFDFSSDFNQQEVVSSKLIFCGALLMPFALPMNIRESCLMVLPISGCAIKGGFNDVEFTIANRTPLRC